MTSVLIEDWEKVRGKRILEHVTWFEIILAIPASNSPKARSPSCHRPLVLESQDENQVPTLTKEGERQTVCVTADPQQTRICPVEQKQGTVHGLLEMEGYECGFDKEFQIYL